MYARRAIGLLFAIFTSTADATEFIGKILDSSSYGYSYAYGPSIAVESGKFHVFYCSEGSGVNSWDAIRYSTSVDGAVWTPPSKVLAVSGGINERAACDPSIVKFDRGDGEKYYLFYSGNIPGYETVMFVARAERINGPYYKYTKRGTWELSPADPRVILYPKSSLPENSGAYGAGQQTVVAKDGKLYAWYTDDTEGYPAPTTSRIYFTSTTDPVNWPSGQRTDVAATSVDVKYNPRSGLFAMYAVEPHHGVDSHLVVRKSRDGVSWWTSDIPCDAACFPDYAHNVGVSGDVRGHLTGNIALVGYGAFYDLNPACTNATCWGKWDLYANYVSTAPSAAVIPLIFNALD